MKHVHRVLRQNMHPKIASARAGHAAVAITLDVNSHAVPSRPSGKPARTMDELFRNIVDK